MLSLDDTYFTHIVGVIRYYYFSVRRYVCVCHFKTFQLPPLMPLLLSLCVALLSSHVTEKKRDFRVVLYKIEKNLTSHLSSADTYTCTYIYIYIYTILYFISDVRARERCFQIHFLNEISN